MQFLVRNPYLNIIIIENKISKILIKSKILQFTNIKNKVKNLHVSKGINAFLKYFIYGESLL